MLRHARFAMAWRLHCMIFLALSELFDLCASAPGFCLWFALSWRGKF